ADFGVQPGSFRRGIIRCQPGYYAFGGGGYFTTADNNGVLWASDNVSNAPTADGNGWTFAGSAPSNAHKLVVIAQCAPKIGRDLLVQFGTLSGGDISAANSYADCPAGYTAIAGGYYLSNIDGSEATPGLIYWSVPASHA